MDTQTTLTVLTAFFIASFLKGLTGLGFSTICLGILAMFIDIKLAIPLVFLPSLASNLMVMVQAGHFLESIKRFWLLYLSALPGLIGGIFLLDHSDGGGPRAVLGAVMLTYGLWAFKNETFILSPVKERKLLAPVGFISGLINGATGSQIMPIMPYLLSLRMDRDTFVQTINCAFTFNTLVMMAGLGKLGMLTLPVLYLSIAGIIPVTLGIFLGGLIRNKVTEEVFRKAVLILLIVMGINLMLMIV